MVVKPGDNGDSGKASKRQANPASLLKAVFICATILLLLDAIILARSLSLFYFPGELDEFGMAQRGGFGVAHQLKRFAKQVGALEHPEVQEVLTRLDAALGLAASPAEVARALSVEAREAQEVIAFAAGDTTGSRSRQVDGTRVKEQIQELQEEVRVFREELEKLSRVSGYAEISGPGIIVYAYDAPDGFRSSEIIHDKDVRDIVNLLFWSGAKGVEVGGRRIIAQSSIRCAGPILLVNHRPVAVNPVVIRAVGDPDALAGSLFELNHKMSADGKRLEAESLEMITLPAYTRGYDSEP
ncbi:MAG: DUF881 domain-containing protein [Bacillota bacterium]|jgi:uncharacterized protein YlxW (UPF0749 family)|nr:DUF881 domain-containing protein [Bacillota bacterium]MDI9415708.1 DUF881 domain-containing protein [Bacillota bacterium]NLD12306.1 DUF881 domain-containing protein [Bacillota bacterium]HCD41357.1 hypothetical protein [Bacillota bacterium]HOB88360.1 DUF881 domain-containing protein [Bacillota bacterium]